MKDPALGRTRAERAFGKDKPTPKEPAPKRSRLNEFRLINGGMFDGPKASYGRYNVSEQSADILNRSKRNMDMR